MADVSTVNSTLDVNAKYEQLLCTLLNDTSIYIRTKDTLTELVTAGDLGSSDKAKLIAEVLGSLNTSMVNAALQTALTWATKEEELEMEKLKLAKELDLADNKILTEAATTNKVKADTLATDAQTTKLYGTATVDPTTGRLLSLGDDGKVTKETELLSQQTLNAMAEEDVLKSKLKESKASVYKIIADTAANFGNLEYTLPGESAEVVSVTSHLDTGTLAYEQLQIAKNQSMGYQYNAWANGVNAASTTVGLLISESLLTSGGVGEQLLTAMTRGVENLVGTGITTPNLDVGL
jgi:hypothetical protein